MHAYLGVNIDHIATLRNARGEEYPDLIRAAQEVVTAEADLITVHLREDRRHIREHDIARLKHEIPLPLNLEMAATEEMVSLALYYRPQACCIVPEKRAELTTEGGLDVMGQRNVLRRTLEPLQTAGIAVSLFVDPRAQQLEAAQEIGAQIIELHTGVYCNAQDPQKRRMALGELQQAASYAQTLGLECHAGHGLSFETVKDVAAIENITTLHIGHFIIAEAIFCGLHNVVRRMRMFIKESRI